MKFSLLISLAATLPLINAQDGDTTCPLESNISTRKGTRCNKRMVPQTNKHILDYSEDMTLAECAESCFTAPACKSFNYQDESKCTRYTRQGKSLGLMYTPPSWDVAFYNKNCFYRPTTCDTSSPPVTDPLDDVYLIIRAATGENYAVLDTDADGRNDVELLPAQTLNPDLDGLRFSLTPDGSLVGRSGNPAYTLNGMIAFPDPDVASSFASPITCSIADAMYQNLQCSSIDGGTPYICAGYLVLDTTDQASDYCTPAKIGWENEISK